MNIEGKTAYVLFGGIGSGKTTLAENLERHGGQVISTDRFLYERDRHAMKGLSYDGFIERDRLIEGNDNNYLVIDGMPRPELIRLLKSTKHSVTAVYLNLTERTRRARFEKRDVQQREIIGKLSSFLGVDLGVMEASEIAGYCTAHTTFQRVDIIKRDEYQELLRQLYWLGGFTFDKLYPIPLEKDDIDYVVEYSESAQLMDIERDEIDIRRIPFMRYRNERTQRSLRLCIWDVGNVLYEYSLAPLVDLMRSKSQEPNGILRKIRGFSLAAYMRGEWDFTRFCRELCNFLTIQYSSPLELDIAKALQRGRGRKIQVSHDVMLQMRRQGIRNVILSNALPVLKTEFNDSNEWGVQKEEQFLSFRTGHLKPNREALSHVLNTTGIDPADALFVDDKRRNVLAGIEQNVASVLFKPSTFLREVAYQLPNTFV